MASKQLVSFLAKITSMSGTGYYGELIVVDYKGQRFKCYRGNLNDKEVKAIWGKWRFIRMEYRDEQLYFNKQVECKPELYQMFVQELRLAAAKDKEAKEKNNDLS